MGVLGTAGKGATKLLSNPKVQKFLLYLVIGLVILYILNRSVPKFERWMRSTFLPVRGDNVNAPISDTRKAELENIAGELYDAIYGIPGAGFVEKAMGSVLALPDNEFTYVVQYYEKFLSDNSMYVDVDWEIMPFDTEDDKLLTRLKDMNLA